VIGNNLLLSPSLPGVWVELVHHVGGKARIVTSQQKMIRGQGCKVVWVLRATANLGIIHDRIHFNQSKKKKFARKCMFSWNKKRFFCADIIRLSHAPPKLGADEGENIHSIFDDFTMAI
jgi:hypothetical protein